MGGIDNARPLKIALAWKRIVAYLIDILLLNLVFTLIRVISTWPIELQNWLMLWLFLFYNVASDFFFQRSVGKKMVKIKVVSISGQPPTLFQAFTRNFGKIISTLPLMWGFIRVFTPSYKQTIHDELSRCFVVEE
jgi:uncharacterized RDD family membrane protein YckC